MPKQYDFKKFEAKSPKTKDDWLAIAAEATQLFTPRTPIKLKDYFNGRRPQLTDVTDAIMQSGGHAIIYGERGVGKSSLAEVLHFYLMSIGRSVYSFPINADCSDNFSSLWRKVFEEIYVRYDNGRDASLEAVKNLMEIGEIGPNDVRRSFDAIFKPHDLPIVIIDEFNELTDSDVRMLVASTVKLLSDRGTNATLVLVGVADDVTELVSNYPSVERAISQIHIPRMKEEDLEEIVESRVAQLGMEISDDALSKIVQISSGLPAYVHNLGQWAVKNAAYAERLQINENDVDLAVEKVIKLVGASALDAYVKATQSNHAQALYRQVLFACALTPVEDDGYFKPQDVCKPLGRILGRKVQNSTFQRHLPEFASAERGDILTCKGSERKLRYRFSEPIIQPFVILKGIQDGLIRGDIKSLLSLGLRRSAST